MHRQSRKDPGEEGTNMLAAGGTATEHQAVNRASLNHRFEDPGELENHRRDHGAKQIFPIRRGPSAKESRTTNVVGL
jgi:hypothetical protein